MAVGSQGYRSWNRSLEGVRSSPCFNFAFGGFTKFGCSTWLCAVDTDRRLLTGDQSVERWKKQPMLDEPIPDHNGLQAVLSVTLLNRFSLNGLTNHGS